MKYIPKSLINYNDKSKLLRRNYYIFWILKKTSLNKINLALFTNLYRLYPISFSFSAYVVNHSININTIYNTKRIKKKIFRVIKLCKFFNYLKMIVLHES